MTQHLILSASFTALVVFGSLACGTQDPDAEGSTGTRDSAADAAASTDAQGLAGDKVVLTRDGRSIDVGVEERACEKDTECTLVPNDCICTQGCALTAISSSREQSYQTAFEQACVDYGGAACPCAARNVVAGCVAGQCEVLAAPVANASAADAAASTDAQGLAGDEVVLTRDGRSIDVGVEERACEKDTECTLVPNDCICTQGCALTAISSSREQSYQTAFEQACVDYGGAACPCAARNVVAGCVAGQCEVLAAPVAD